MAPENTLSAFKLAYEQGANMLETDLQFTIDGYAIAFHNLNHLYNNNFTPINKMTFAEIKKIDVGSWFHPKFKNEKIPSIEEILQFAKNKIYINFEIKDLNNNFNKNNILKVIDTVENSNMLEYVMFASFNYEIIKYIKNVNPKIHTAAIKIPGNNILPSEIAKITNCEAFICDFNELNNEIHQNCIENNLYIGTYSIDNEENFQKIIKYNIKAIGTNFPATIKQLIKKYNYYSK